ncbi:MAG: crossover junction endodeoxyribonuclease RuvC [Candidatus Acidiferrales bacterium]
MSANGSVARKSFRVLGLDPALAGATGYGVVELHGQAAAMLRFGALRFPTRASFAERLREIHKMVAQLVDEFSPDAVAVESVFAALNMRTAFRLAEVRGVILLAAAQAGIPAHSYSPREVKASVAGSGGASKQQMQQMVKVQLGLCEQPEPADAADALAVALCHAHFAWAAERLERSMIVNPVVAVPRARATSRSHFSAARIPIQR